MAKNEVADLSGQTCVNCGYFILILICQFNFREISMITMVILGQNKPFWLILKKQN